MSHAKNKIEWCLRKAERELKSSHTHRGIVKVNPNTEEARKHIKKAEHYLEATIYLKKGSFSDISASTAFYAMYHCLLGIAVKFGYESRNQECTFVLINSLIEDGKISLEKPQLDKIFSLDIERSKEQTAIEVRELCQYGTSLSLKDNVYDDQFELAKEIISKTKEIIEE